MPLQHHQYSNGLRMIYEKSHNDTPLTHIYLYCDVGSVHEPDNLRGVSHFIEHMCFKGTSRIPNAKDIFIEYDKIGANFNAFTIKRTTCYIVSCQNDYVHNCVSILGDMLFNSTFPKREYEKEYAVVVEENLNDSNDFEEVVYENTAALLYKNSSYEFPVDSIKYHSAKTPMDYDEVMRFYHNFYVPENMVASIVSALPFSKIKSIVASTLFAKNNAASRGKSGIFPICHELAPQSDIQFHLQNKKGVTNTMLTIGFRTCDMNSPDKYALQLLKTILIGGMSGRLFMLLREKHGLTYSIRVETENYEKMGGFTIFTQTESAKLLKNNGGKGVLPLLVDCIIDLVKNGVTETEFEIAKGNQKGTIMIDRAKDEDRAEYNGFEALVRENTGGIVSYDDLYEKCIRPVKRTDVCDAVRKYFTRDRMSVCLLAEKLPSLGSIQKLFIDVV